MRLAALITVMGGAAGAQDMDGPFLMDATTALFVAAQEAAGRDPDEAEARCYTEPLTQHEVAEFVLGLPEDMVVTPEMMDELAERPEVAACLEALE